MVIEEINTAYATRTHDGTTGTGDAIVDWATFGTIDSVGGHTFNEEHREASREYAETVITTAEHASGVGGLAKSGLRQGVKEGLEHGGEDWSQDAAERSAREAQERWRREAATKATKKKDLPRLDATGKVHGDLPHPKDLNEYHPEDLRQLADELRQSVRERIRKNSELGPSGNHGLRQAQEQDLIKSIEKHLDG